jgi:DNA-binding CsgD family transcriptional regulator
LRFGVVVTDAKGEILRANSLAERMLRTGTTIVRVRNTLQARRSSANAELRAAIRLASKDESALGRTGLAVRLTQQGEAPVLAHVLPIRRRSPEINAAAAVFVGGVSTSGADAMAVAYDLTQSETRLVDFLLGGKSMSEAAALLNISQNTAKTHLRHVFVKTGVSRQVDLARLAAKVTSPAASS